MSGSDTRPTSNGISGFNGDTAWISRCSTGSGPSGQMASTLDSLAAAWLLPEIPTTKPPLLDELDSLVASRNLLANLENELANRATEDKKREKASKTRSKMNTLTLPCRFLPTLPVGVMMGELTAALPEEELENNLSRLVD